MSAATIMAITNFATGVLLLLIGLYLRLAKNSSWLIAGYNTMSDEEQSKWNEKAMRRFIGGELIAIASVLAAAGVLALLDVFPAQIITASWCAFVVRIIFCLIYLNKSPRFKV